MKLSLAVAMVIGGILAAHAQQAVITSGPQNSIVNAGAAADFTVSATSATGYQWAFDGTNISGATNAELNIQNVSTNQAGTYTVVVSSAGTNVASSATLTVLQGTIVSFKISTFADGSSSNVLVELFDHDKPVTVQNFLHYILSPAYSNTFLDRVIPGFILQGGDYVTTSRTDPRPFFETTHYTNYFYIPNEYINGPSAPNPPLDSQVDSEFFYGPTVSNTAGTLALALPQNNRDGGNSAFFFNLVDNPFLDSYSGQQGPFTVFGRVIGGMAVLDYFNSTNNFFKTSTNIFTNGIWDQTYLTSSPTFTDLPINYYTTNLPGCSNLFYVDFSFPATNAQPAIETNPPTGLTIDFPTNNAVLTNAAFSFTGTAQDTVGIANVHIELQPLNGAYGNGPLTGYAGGTTNWTISGSGAFQYGTYDLIVSDQNGAGYIGGPVTNFFTITAVLVNGDGNVTASNVATHVVFTNAYGANLNAGQTYAFTAQPGPGQFFSSWSYGTNTSTHTSITNVLTQGLVFTANFTSNGITFVNPPPGGAVSNGNFAFRGFVSTYFTEPVTVSCRLYSATTRQEIGPALQINATNSWSFLATNFTVHNTNLAVGRYFAVVTAVDAVSHTSVFTNYFAVGFPITLNLAGNGRGTFSPITNGQLLLPGQRYTNTAAAVAGSVFVSWSNNLAYASVPVTSFVMEPGLTLAATFASNDIPGAVIAITYPASAAQLTNRTFTVTGSISATLTNPVVSYQLFENSNSLVPLSSTNVVLGPGVVAGHAVSTSTWSAGLTNLSPGYYTLVAAVTDQGGRSATVSRTFQVLARVTLQVYPPGAGAVRSNWSGSYISTGLTSSRYLITALTNGGYVFAYWTNSAGLLFQINPFQIAVPGDMTFTAVFDTNYFYRVAGTYNGLFQPVGTNGVFDPVNTMISPTNAGGYTMTVDHFGKLTMALSFPGLRLTSTGYFPLFTPYGTATAAFAWSGLDGKLVTNHVNLYLNSGINYLDGDVTNAKFSSYLLAFRAITNATANSLFTPGTNVLLIPGDHAATNDHPGGDSYATLTLSAKGAITLGGSMADNTAFTVGTGIASEYNVVTTTNSTNYYTNSIWPLFAPLYGGTGMVLGWITNSSPSNFTGAIAWNKPTTRTAADYTNGFFWFTNAFSTPCVPPVAGTHYQIAFGGASLTNGITNTLTVGTSGLFTVDADQTNHLVLTLTRKSGVLTGSFSYPRGTVVHNLYGAFANPTQGGSGYFLDTNKETGFFEITPIAPIGGGTGTIGIAAPLQNPSTGGNSSAQNNPTPGSGE
jgi:cyclophilin family peptidyl-prolyl cis-trans isomerase